MTDTSPAAVSAMIDLLERPYGNLTGGEKLDAANMIAALYAQLDAANQRHGGALEAVELPEVRALVDALITIRDKKSQCNRAVDCQHVARAALAAFKEPRT